MRYRKFPRTGWQIAEIGYGMWGMAAGPARTTTSRSPSLDRAIEARLQLLRHRLGLRRRPQRTAARAGAAAPSPATRLYVATKVPPKNRSGRRSASIALDDVFPADHIREYTEKSLENLGVDRIDLQQFHVWNDAWAADERWQRAVRRPEARGTRSGPSASASIAGSRPTCCARSHRAGRRASRSSTTSSTRRRRTSCSRSARS